MDINIYPNPSCGKVFICGAEIGTEVCVSNKQGEEVYCFTPMSTHSIIDLSAQPEGVYLMEIRLQQKVDLRKIVLEK